MSMAPLTDRNYRVVLAARPQGRPSPACFRHEEAPMPTPGPGEALIRTIYLSLDPYMRDRMNERGAYADGVSIGDVMIGETIGLVVESRVADLAPGMIVACLGGWSEYSLASPADARVIEPSSLPLSYHLGILGVPGLSAYVGMTDIGKPKAGETLVVAAATGGVGAVVGQLGKLHGCHVVGIVSSEEKRAFALEVLGFDACIRHDSESFAEDLALATPHGIDIYFENVGGKMLKAIPPRLNIGARIPLCGLVSHYNGDRAGLTGGDFIGFMMSVLSKRVSVSGFIVSDHFHRAGEYVAQATAWLSAGRLKTREHHVRGLAAAPRAFIDMLEGHNFGKTIVQLAADPFRRDPEVPNS